MSMNSVLSSKTQKQLHSAFFARKRLHFHLHKSKVDQRHKIRTHLFRNYSKIALKRTNKLEKIIYRQIADSNLILHRNKGWKTSKSSNTCCTLTSSDNRKLTQFFFSTWALHLPTLFINAKITEGSCFFSKKIVQFQ